MEETAREHYSAAGAGRKGRFVDRERGSRHAEAGEEAEAARASCSRDRGTVEAERQRERMRRAGVCSRHRRGEPAERKNRPSEAKRRKGEGGGEWGRRHKCLAETGRRAVEGGGTGLPALGGTV